MLGAAREHAVRLARAASDEVVDQHAHVGFAALRGPGLAPFHLLATEGAVHADRSHEWHMEQASRICAADDSGVLFATSHRVVALTDRESEAAATAWWEELTGRGGEGMVVKPLEFTAQGRRGLVQPR